MSNENKLDLPQHIMIMIVIMNAVKYKETKLPHIKENTRGLSEALLNNITQSTRRDKQLLILLFHIGHLIIDHDIISESLNKLNNMERQGDIYNLVASDGLIHCNSQSTLFSAHNSDKILLDILSVMDINFNETMDEIDRLDPKVASLIDLNKSSQKYTPKEIKDILEAELTMTDEELYDNIDEILSWKDTSIIIEFSDIPVQEETLKKLSKNNNLIKLKLSFIHSNITKIPEAIFTLDNLEVLHVSNLETTEIQTAIGNLKNLKMLTVIQTQITTVPESISELTSLETLELEINHITHLPSSIGDMRSLRCINLMDNELTELPDSMSQLSNLEELNLSYMPSLTSVPQSIINLQETNQLKLITVNIDGIQDEVEDEEFDEDMFESLLYGTFEQEDN